MISVQKYGGCFLKNMEDLKATAHFVAENIKDGDQVVLVVAAMQSIASGIINMATDINTHLSQGELDSLFSSGEKQTAALMAVALEQEGIEAASISDLKGRSLSELDQYEGKHEMNFEAIHDVLSQNKVAVVAGFQGIGDFCKKDKKGRYGAAATAVCIAAELGCDCELYGNTKAVYTLDPAASKDRPLKTIPKISYEETMEMILLGGGDLESRAIELAKTFDVKVYIGEALQKDKEDGTYIMSKNLIVEESAVTGISVSEDVAVYTLSNISGDGESVAELFEQLGDLGINVDMISQQMTGDDTCMISFSCPRDRISKIDKAFEGNQRLKEAIISKKEDIALISVIGIGMASHAGVASRVFSLLAENSIPYYNITTSEISISTVVDSENKNKAVVILGEGFNL